MKITIKSESELIKVCEKLEVLLKEAPVVLLKGDMAAGKTTFVKAFCQYKGVMDTAASPTFGLVNEYAYQGGKIYHFDLYRIEDEEELYDIGFEEYLDSGNICFVEWPEIAKNFLPNHFILVNLLVEENLNRTFSIEVH